MDANRFSRIETRVDEIKDDLAEVKAEQKIISHSILDLKEDIHKHTLVVRGHVAGDEKIISELIPLIGDYKFHKEKTRRRNAQLKDFSIKIGIVTAVLGLVGGVIKFFVSF